MTEWANVSRPYPVQTAPVSVTNFPPLQAVTVPTPVAVQEVSPVPAASPDTVQLQCGASPESSTAPTPSPSTSTAPSSPCIVALEQNQYLTWTLFASVFLILALVAFVFRQAVPLTRGD